MRVTASCEFPFLEKWKEICETNKLCEYMDSVLSGYAQITFSDNTFSGIVILLATLIGSPVQAISAICATIAGTLTAYFMGVPKPLIRIGLYGFNSVLSGLIIPLLIFPGQGVTLNMLIVSATAGIMCTFSAAAIGSFLGKWNIAFLAAPYCVVIFILISASILFGSVGSAPFEPAIATLATEQAFTMTDFASATLNGIAQVLLIQKPICAILYITALLLSSRIDAVNSVVGAIAGTFVAFAFGFPRDMVMSGLFGFNAILLMHVMTRAFAPSVKSYLLAVLSAGFTSLVAVSVKVVLAPLGVPSFLAIPYVLVCVTIFLGRDMFGGLTYIPAIYWGVPETIYKALKENKIPKE